jgi:hypothetical protein
MQTRNEKNPRLAFPQVSNAAPSSRRTMVREDSAVLAGCGPRWPGSILNGFVVVDPVSSVVPASLKVSMVVEGFHGNRGLVP